MLNFWWISIKKWWLFHTYFASCCLVTKLCPTLVTPWAVARQARLSVGICPCSFLHEGLFLTQRSNCVSRIGRQILYWWATREAHLTLLFPVYFKVWRYGKIRTGPIVRGKLAYPLAAELSLHSFMCSFNKNWAPAKYRTLFWLLRLWQWPQHRLLLHGSTFWWRNADKKEVCSILWRGDCGMEM